MEIEHLDNLDGVCVIKFKRLAGETWNYKEISCKVLTGM